MNTFNGSNATSWQAQPHCEVYGWKARKEMTNEKLTLATEKVASNKDNDVQIGILYLHHILERLKVTEENNSWNKIAIHMCIKTWKITIAFDSTLMSKSSTLEPTMFWSCIWIRAALMVLWLICWFLSKIETFNFLFSWNGGCVKIRMRHQKYFDHTVSYFVSHGDTVMNDAETTMWCFY